MQESPAAGFKRGERRRLEKEVKKSAIATYRQIASSRADAYQPEFQNKLNRYAGVLCFSAVNDSLLMWAHYADCHRGFVLEFDTEDEEFQKLGDLYKVIYSKERPVLVIVNGITVDIYLHKSPEWEYECEYRLLRTLQACERRSISNVGDLFFVPMPRSCVKAVYLGNRMDPTTAKQISGIMAGTPAELHQTELHLHEFKLVFKRIR
jgi:hypothetical protein